MFDATRFRQDPQAFQAQITTPNQHGDGSDDSDDADPIIDASDRTACQNLAVPVYKRNQVLVRLGAYHQPGVAIARAGDPIPQ